MPPDRHGGGRPPGARRTGPRPSRVRRIAVGVGTVVVLVVVFVGVLPQFADYGAAQDAARSLPAVWLVALAVAAVAGLVLYCLQWSAALRELSLRQAVEIATASFMVSNGVPGGGAVVLPMQYSMLGDNGVAPSRATAATAVTAVYNLLATAILPVVGATVLAATEQGGPARWPLILLGVGGITVVVVVLRAVVRSETAAIRVGTAAERAAHRVLGWFGRDRDLDWTGAVARWRSSTVDILADRWLWLVGGHVLAQGGQYLVLAVALAGLQRDADVTTTLATSFFAFGLARLGTLLPVTPGGLGTVDGLLTALLVGAGNATSADALAAVLIWRALTFLPGLVVGAAAFFAWRRRQAARGGEPWTG